MLKKKELIIIICIFCCCSTVLILRFFLNKEKASDLILVVTSHEEIILEASLSENLTKKIESEEGYNLIVIENGGASVLESDCASQICVNSATISEPGETIACLPHELLLEIRSKSNEE